jgi:hypothetical protein
MVNMCLTQRQRQLTETRIRFGCCCDTESAVMMVESEAKEVVRRGDVGRRGIWP